MKKLIIIFLTFFIVLNNVNSQDIFERIITIDNLYKELIDDDFKSTNADKLFYYFTLVSEESARFDEFNQWFINIKEKIELEAEKDFGSTNVNDFTDSVKKRFAESLLLYIHNFVFKEYNYNSNKISEIIYNGNYNCVSSSILYAIFLKKYGLNCSAIETSDHVFIEISFKEDKIDVETTNRYGFNPGSKKEVLDDFGKVTGFNYVSPKDYKNRNKIDLKKLFFLLSHNLANAYFKSNDYIKSTNLGFIIYKGRNDNKGKEEFDVYFNNLIVYLSNKKEYLNAIELINKYFDNWGLTETFIKIRFDLINNYTIEWNDYNNFDDIRQYLTNQNQKYEKLKNNKRFIESYFNVIYKMITFYNKNKNIENSFILLKSFNNSFKHAETSKLFSNCLIDYFDIFYKEQNMPKFQEEVARLKSLYSEFISDIEKYERVYMINFVNDTLNKGEIEKALSEAKKMRNLYPKDKDVLSLLKNCYVKYTVFLYEKRDIENTIKFSNEGLAYFPYDSTLTNNFKAFFQNFIYEAIENKDYTKAREMVNKGLDLFGKETYFLQADKLLKEKKY